jgi:hypothetical protein
MIKEGLRNSAAWANPMVLTGEAHVVGIPDKRKRRDVPKAHTWMTSDSRNPQERGSNEPLSLRRS